MEMKLKFAEFAELIGTTAKTVYKMEERKEIVTVTEKVNNRPTRLVVTNNEQINHFKNVYSILMSDVQVTLSLIHLLDTC